MKIRLLLWILLLGGGSIQAQGLKDWSPFAPLHGGYTLRIHPDYPEIQRPGWAVNVGLIRRGNSERDWTFIWREMRISLSWTFLDTGNPKVLGFATGPLLSMEGLIFDTRNFQLRYSLGTGFGIMTRPFDRQQNAQNIAIGSRLTSLAQFQLFGQWRWTMTPRTSIQVGISGWHYSAARVRVPNLGVNVPALFIGVSPNIRRGCIKGKFELDLDKRVRPGIRLGNGFTSRKVAGGPLYPVPTLMGLVHGRLTNLIRWQAGVKAFFEESLFAFYQNQDFPGDNLQRDATGVIAWVGAEWLLGRVGINARLGPYLKRPVLMDYPLYTELGIQYYLRDQQLHFRNQPFIGLYVHAHSGEADWAELAVGWLF